MESRDGLGDGLHFDANFPEFLQIRTEDLDGDGGGNAAQHVADAVGQWTAHHTENARHCFDFRVDVIEDFLPAAARLTVGLSTFFEIHVELDAGNRDDMVTAFGAAKTAADLAHLWD